MNKVDLIKELRKYRMSASVFGVKKELYATAYLNYKDSLKAVVYKAASGSGGSHGDSVSGICLAYEKAELGMLNAMWHSVSDMRNAVTLINMSAENELGCTILWMLYVGEMTPMEIRRTLHISKDSYYRSYNDALEMILTKVNEEGGEGTCLLKR